MLAWYVLATYLLQDYGKACRKRLLWLCTEAGEHILEIVEHPADSRCLEQVGFVEAHHR